MDQDDSLDAAALAASRPLPASSSATTVGSAASGRDEAEDDYEMEFDLDHEQHNPSRPITSHRVSKNGEDDADEPNHDDAGDIDHGAPTPTCETRTEPYKTLRADDIPDLGPPRISNKEQQAQEGSREQGLSPGEATFDDRSSMLPTRKDPNDSFIGRVLRRNLQDIDSSFTTPLSPLPTVNGVGFDDTFVFDSPSKPPSPGPILAYQRRPGKE